MILESVEVVISTFTIVTIVPATSSSISVTHITVPFTQQPQERDVSAYDKDLHPGTLKETLPTTLCSMWWVYTNTALTYKRKPCLLSAIY